MCYAGKVSNVHCKGEEERYHTQVHWCLTIFLALEDFLLEPLLEPLLEVSGMVKFEMEVTKKIDLGSESTSSLSTGLSVPGIPQTKTIFHENNSPCLYIYSRDEASGKHLFSPRTMCCMVSLV